MEFEMETEALHMDSVGEISMDVDLSDEQTIIAELHSCRLHLQATLPTQDDKIFYGVPVESSHVNYSDFLYLILDTNVLLSHLKFLKELKDHSLKDIGKPVLVIPWIVIQELDTLKNVSGTVGSQAKSAGKFIHDCLQAHHPRVKGQTVEEVNTELHNLSISNNDDRILHCCLVYQYKIKLQGDPGVVVLFSNDTMLCTKAKINGIISCNRKTLMNELKNLIGKPGAVSYTQTHEYLYKVDQQLMKDDTYRLIDDCLSQAESYARDAFSVIIENEMRDVYGELSTDVMGRKPPWNLEDALYMLDKHWIAVFSYTFSNTRSTTKHLVQLLQEHSQKELKQIPNDVLSFISNSLGILEQFYHKPDIWPKITLSVASLKVLQEKIQLTTSSPANVQAPPTPTPTQQQQHVVYPQVVSTVLPPVPHLSLTLQQMVNQCPTNPLDLLFWIFQLIRETIINGTITYQTALSNGTFGRDSELKLIEMLKYLEEILIPLENLLNNGIFFPVVRTLYQTLVNYLKLMLNISCPLSESQLCDLCQVDGIQHTFRDALSFLMDGRYQLAQILHQVAQPIS